jgi:hypothetical protein
MWQSQSILMGSNTLLTNNMLTVYQSRCGSNSTATHFSSILMLVLSLLVAHGMFEQRSSF